MSQKPFAWMYADAFDEHFTRDRAEFETQPGIESFTPLYDHPQEAPFCVECGDQITAHDPGLCGVCSSTKRGYR
ncbi:hypothetical protein [Castellaniella sp.]|uniref:hypothetical protein n=1 Tax=Castellaniella sp. TaxID=1955812 RepID=UPI002AFF67A6|nr:hypothetical protein [Castellaniella sp.]